MGSDITKEQLGILRHALGYNAETGEGHEYRNHYATQPEDERLQELVDAGLMRRGSDIPGGLAYFIATDEGKQVVYDHRDDEVLLRKALNDVLGWCREDYQAQGATAEMVLDEIESVARKALGEVGE